MKKKLWDPSSPVSKTKSQKEWKKRGRPDALFTGYNFIRNNCKNIINKQIKFIFKNILYPKKYIESQKIKEFKKSPVKNITTRNLIMKKIKTEHKYLSRLAMRNTQRTLRDAASEERSYKTQCSLWKSTHKNEL